MIVQLTDYGVSVLTETKKPLNITKYILGSSVNYTPSQDAVNIKGEAVYTNSPTKPIAVSANVVKYTCTIGYNVGNFSFGEAAFFDDTNTCVAISVADVLIDKQKYQDTNIGNSIVLDLYLSMVDGNYDMWIDDMRSDNEFNLPVCGSPDALPPVSQSSSNFYIITSAGRGQSSTLAYASMSGLWNFDCYQYKNSHEFTVLRCTEGAVYIDAKNLNLEDIALLQPDYAGQLVLEFVDGVNQSICRTIASFRVIGTEGVFSLYTPMVQSAEANDTLRVYSRQVFSISDVNLPVATTESLGAVSVGNGLSITPEGELSVNFPVTSVNGQIGDVEITANDIPDLPLSSITGDYNDLLNKPDPYILPIASEETLGGVKVDGSSNISIDYSGYIDLAFNPVKTINGMSPDPGTGNITLKFDESISGLIFPKRIYAQADLDQYAASGLYYILAEDANTLVNAPQGIDFQNDLSLEVLPIGEGFENGPAIQLLLTQGYVFVRQTDGSYWTAWSQFMTTEGMRLATTEQTGIVQIGSGLSIQDNGILSADVLSVFGKTGTVNPNKEDWIQILSPVWDQTEGIPQLTANTSSDASEEESMKYGRVDVRQLTWGAFYLVGDFDASTNTIEGNSNYYISDGGYITYKALQGADADDTITFRPKGWVLRVNGASDTLSIDGITKFRQGDLIMTTGNSWIKLFDNRRSMPWPYGSGFVVAYNSNTYACNFSSSDNSISLPSSFTVQEDGTISNYDIKVNIVDGGTF